MATRGSRSASRASGGPSEGSPEAILLRASRKAAPEALTIPRQSRPRRSKSAAPTASEQLNPPELNIVDEDTASPAAPSMAVVHDVAEGSIVPAESAVEGTGANVIEGGELPAPNSTQGSPAAPADDAAAGLAIATPSDNQGGISCLRLLVTQQQQQITQQQQQITQLLQQGNQGQQQINQKAAEIQQLKLEVARLRDDVGKRSSPAVLYEALGTVCVPVQTLLQDGAVHTPQMRGHQDQAEAASLESSNTQLAALGRGLEMLQKQQPKLIQQTVVETHTATPGQQACRSSPGVADDAHGSIAPERAHNFLLHRFPEGAENEQSLMQLVKDVVHDDVGVKGVENSEY